MESESSILTSVRPFVMLFHANVDENIFFISNCCQKVLIKQKNEKKPDHFQDKTF